jgi:ribosomal protein L11 methyltransferase
VRWIELSIASGPDAVEQIAAVLDRYGQGGVTIEEWQVETGDEKTFRIKIYLPHGRSYNQVRRNIKLSLSSVPVSAPFQLRERLLKPEDWLDSLKKDFGVVAIGARFIIKPSWASPPILESGRMIIELDPGAAFGTGLHPTTRLCLLSLEKYLKPGMSVLDLGTGTGILSIAAAKLGAEGVLALDIDPIAVKAAQSNIKQNAVDHHIQTRRGTLSDRAQKKYESAFDLVLANITSRAISDLSQGFAKVLKPGGRLIVSGIHPQGLDEVLIKLALANFSLENIERDGEWYAVIARNN